MPGFGSRDSTPLLLSPPGQPAQQQPSEQAQSTNTDSSTQLQTLSTTSSTLTSTSPTTSTSSDTSTPTSSIISSIITSSFISTTSMDPNQSSQSSVSFSSTSSSASSNPSSIQSSSSVGSAPGISSNMTIIISIISVVGFAILLLTLLIWRKHYRSRNINDRDRPRATSSRAKWNPIIDDEKDDPWNSITETNEREFDKFDRDFTYHDNDDNDGSPRQWRSVGGVDYLRAQTQTQTTTIKLVEQTQNETYGDRSCEDNYDPEGSLEGRGVFGTIREKIMGTFGSFGPSSSFSGGAIYTGEPVGVGLGRNRSPNKRRSTNQRQRPGFQRAAGAPPPPDEPDWIRPRATSPTQMLSPPLQPHLFFQTQPQLDSLNEYQPPFEMSGQIMGKEPKLVEGGESESEYSESEFEASSTNGMSISPITINYSNITNNGNSRNDDDVNVNMTIKNHIPLPTPRTPRSYRPKSKITSNSTPTTPSSLKRSAAVRDLTGTPTSPTTPTRINPKIATNLRPTLTPTDETAITGITSPSAARSIQLDAARRSVKRIERREEKARDKVEDILRASWSDRANQISTPECDGGEDGGDYGGQVPGYHSPGVEEADRLGSGIDARLALLRKLEN